MREAIRRQQQQQFIQIIMTGESQRYLFQGQWAELCQIKIIDW